MAVAASENVVRLQDFQNSNSSVSISQFNPRRMARSAQASTILIAEPKWEKWVNARLRTLLELQIGWDGFDAKPLDINTAFFGMRLLHHLLPPIGPPPQLSLTNYGGLQFEWYSEKLQFEIEIEAAYKVRGWFLNLATEYETEHVFDYEFHELRKMLQNFILESEKVTDESSAA